MRARRRRIRCCTSSATQESKRMDAGRGRWCKASWSHYGKTFTRFGWAIAGWIRSTDPYRDFDHIGLIWKFDQNLACCLTVDNYTALDRPGKGQSFYISSD